VLVPIHRTLFRQTLSGKGNRPRSRGYRPRPDALEDRCLLTLLPPVSYPVGNGPASVAVADFNGDGHPDIATALSGTGAVSVLLNNGDGTFRSAGISAAGPDATALATGDFNGDGKMDVAVTNTLNNEVSVLLGNGDGTFQATLSLPDSIFPRALAVTDLNSDGHPDIVTASAGGVSGGAVLSVFMGNGDGTFLPHVDYPIGFPTDLLWSVVAGDFNGDGHPDVAVTELGTGSSVDVLIGNGAGSFSSSTPIMKGPVSGALTAADFNGDGKLDIGFITDSSLSLMLGNGDGTFQAPAPVPTSGNVDSVASADFNGDGIPDLIERSVGSYEVELGKGGGAFYPAMTYAFAPGTGVGAVADFNGDGAPDVVGTTTSAPGTVAVMLNAADDVTSLAGAVGFQVTDSGTATAGSLFSVTVTAVDASGNPVPSFRGTVFLGGSDPRTTGSVLAYAFTAADNGTHTFTNDLSMRIAGVQTVTASNPFMATGSATIAITPGPIGRFAVSASDTVAGVPDPVTVTAFDIFGNLATNYTGTVQIETGLGSPPISTATFTAADAGVHTASVIFTAAAVETITVLDSSNNTARGTSSTFTVRPAPASQIVLFTHSLQSFAGLVSVYTVTALDPFGNIATDDQSAIALTTADFPQGFTQTLVNGQVFFSVEWTKVGIKSLTATQLTAPSFTSTLNNILVIAGAATTLQLTGVSNTTAGVAQSYTVTAFDAFHNIATEFTGFVHFNVTDLRASLPADYAFSPGDGGVHTFLIALDTAGPQLLSVRFAASLISTSVIPVTVTPAAASTFAVNGFPTTTAGAAQNFTVTAFDAFGNLAPTYTGTVKFSSSDVQAGLPANYTFTAADAGVHTFAATLKTAGPQSITVTDADVPTISGSESGITVVAGAATHFSVSTPVGVVAGKAFTLTVTALDAFGNVATGYRGKVHFTDSAGNSGLPSDYTFSAADNGVHVFTLSLTITGAQTLMIADVVSPTIKGSTLVTVGQKPSGGKG
jgi:FG-GAP-like repeat